MKERPIIMSAPMIRALREDRKTQTRRVLNPQPIMRDGGDCVVEYARGRQRHSGPSSYLIGEILPRFGCPYGRPGDRLWVRETWRVEAGRSFALRYRADDSKRLLQGRRAGLHVGRAVRTSYGVPVWRPSIFMPRWASRITLEITDVRVQRVQEISEDDARAEGVDTKRYTDGRLLETNRAAFERLWDSINGKRAPWSLNPWVWALTFRRIA